MFNVGSFHYALGWLVLRQQQTSWVCLLKMPVGASAASDASDAGDAGNAGGMPRALPRNSSKATRATSQEKMCSRVPSSCLSCEGCASSKAVKNNAHPNIEYRYQDYRCLSHAVVPAS